MYNYIMKLWLHRFPGNGLRPSFGNNLFGWLAMKVIQQQYGHIEVNHLEELNTPLEISDAVWDRYSLEFEKNQGLRIAECTHRDLHLYAFFQNSTVLLHYRDYLRSLITKENTEYNQGNMFISKNKKIIENYYQTTFEWLEKCEKIFGFKVDGYSKTRIYAFLAERFLPYWFKKNSKFLEWPVFFYNPQKND